MSIKNMRDRLARLEGQRSDLHGEHGCPNAMVSAAGSIHDAGAVCFGTASAVCRMRARRSVRRFVVRTNVVATFV